jgi:hypothetical protein
MISCNILYFSPICYRHSLTLSLLLLSWIYFSLPLVPGSYFNRQDADVTTEEGTRILKPDDDPGQTIVLWVDPSVDGGGDQCGCWDSQNWYSGRDSCLTVSGTSYNIHIPFGGPKLQSFAFPFKWISKNNVVPPNTPSVYMCTPIPPDNIVENSKLPAFNNW